MTTRSPPIKNAFDVSTEMFWQEENSKNVLIYAISQRLMRTFSDYEITFFRIFVKIALYLCAEMFWDVKKNSFESFFTHVKPIRISDGNFILILGHKDFSMFVTNLTDVCGGRIWHKNVYFAKKIWHFFQNCSEVIWYDCQIWVQLFGKK